MRKTRVIVFMALFIAMHIILARFISYQTPIVRVSLEFLPIALAAMMFGPVVGGITGALADIMGMILFSRGAAYFPGFTLSAFLSGAVYGLLLYKKPKSLLRIGLAVVIITLFVDLGLNTYWLTILTGKAAYAILTTRIISNAIMFGVKIFLIYTVWKLAGAYIEKSYLHENAS